MIRSQTRSRTRFLLPALVLAALLSPASPCPVADAASSTEPSSQAPLSLLPSSADLVVWVDYFALRKSDLLAEMESRIDSLPEAGEDRRRFIEETGLDPRQDIDQILISLRGADNPAGEGFLLVAQGRFTGSKLVEKAAAKGGTLSTTPKGIPIWSSREKSADTASPEQGRGIFALVQTNESTILYGSEAEVQRAMNVAIRAKSPATPEPRLRELLSGVDRKAPIWAALNSATFLKRASSGLAQGGELNFADALGTVDSVRMSAWVGADLDLKVQLAAKDPESAGLLTHFLRGLVAAGKLAAKDKDPELLKMLQELTLTQGGKGIDLKVRIPGSRLRRPPEKAPEN